MVPLTNPSNQAPSPSATYTQLPLHVSSTAAVAANIDTTSSITKYARYIHQITCSLPASTLLRALDLSEELATISSLTTTLIKNHLPHSTATNKGHMQCHQDNTASTLNMQANIIAAHVKVDRMCLPHKICAMQDMFCFAVLADAIAGTMYTSIIGTFLVCSFKSMQYVFLYYIYSLNAIIVRAMPSCTDASMVQAFTKVISILKFGGYHPALNVMDNKCSSVVKKYIRNESINIQLVLPHNHQANAAKRPIATFKEHFIAALATVDLFCPLQLWDEFLPQVKLPLNMLRIS
jgi:hypothetical protein